MVAGRKESSPKPNYVHATCTYEDRSLAAPPPRRWPIPGAIAAAALSLQAGSYRRWASSFAASQSASYQLSTTCNYTRIGKCQLALKTACLTAVRID